MSERLREMEAQVNTARREHTKAGGDGLFIMLSMINVNLNM